MKPLHLATIVSLLIAVAPGAAQATLLGSNLIVDGDAESGTSTWTGIPGVTALATADYASSSAFLYPDAPHGNRMFVGGSGGLAAGWQAVDVSDMAAAIDAGRIGFSLSAYLGGVGDQEDNPLLYVSFTDASGGEIGHTELGPIFIDLRDYLTVLGGFRTEGWLPGGTRGIQLTLSMDAPDGDSSGAFADNLSFTLSQSVPEPQSWALTALGLAAAAAVSRRRGR